MRKFCKETRILHEYFAPRTQKNGVVERKNRTLIEAPRTMLGGSTLPTDFWAEVVNKHATLRTYNWHGDSRLAYMLHKIVLLVLSRRADNKNLTRSVVFWFGSVPEFIFESDLSKFLNFGSYLIQILKM